MMKSCPECSGKVPVTYEECPFCGYLFAAGEEPAANTVPDGVFSGDEEDIQIDCFTRKSDAFEDDSGIEYDNDDSNNEPLKPVRAAEHSSDEPHVGSSLKRWFFEFLLFMLALLAAGLIVIVTDFKGARTELRRICMTDSGDASREDQNLFRVKVKHYILVGLDLIDHGGTGSSVRTNSDAFNKPKNIEKLKTEPTVQNSPEPVKTEKLPPSPPKVEDLESSLNSPQAAGKEKNDVLILQQSSPEKVSVHESR